jgi:predicted molibdopterin-dependent oxidoreductase YjgC
VQRVRKAIEPIGESKPDWWIACQIANRIGVQGFEYEKSSEIMEEIVALTPSYGGITYSRIEDIGLQWPCPDEEHLGTPYLYKEKFNRPNGKAKLHPVKYRPSAEEPSDEYPLVLTTDRSLYHYHTATMTRRVEGLETLDGEEFLKMHPSDAKKLSVEDGERVRVVSRRGETEVRTKVTRICRPGLVSMTFHFHESPSNVLTNDAVDPIAKIPETKVAAVRVEKI